MVKNQVYRFESQHDSYKWLAKFETFHVTILNSYNIITAIVKIAKKRNKDQGIMEQHIF